VSIEPANATVKDVAWQSGNHAIATVDANGLVTFTGKEGTVRITATSADGPAHYKDIKVARNVTKIRTPLTTVNITKGKKLKLPVAFYDGKATVTKKAGKTFKSSNKKVVTVNAKTGKIKAKKKGKAKITLTTANGKSLTIKVKVGKKAVKLKKFKLKGIKKKALSLKAGKTKDLKIKLAQKKASDLKVKFKSSKKRVVKVDAVGRITAVKKGKATITAKVGKKTVKIKVKVK
jgi:alpha-amylase